MESYIREKLRVKSDSKNCGTHLKNLLKWFNDRGCTENIIDNQLKRVKNKSREELLRSKERGSKTIGILFVVIYQPHLKHLGNLIQNNIKHSYANPKVTFVFTPALLSHFLLYIT